MALAPGAPATNIAVVQGANVDMDVVSVMLVNDLLTYNNPARLHDLTPTTGEM